MKERLQSLGIAPAAAETSLSPADYLRSYLRRLRSGEIGSWPTILGLVVIALIFQSQNQNFLTARNFVNLIVQMAGYTVIAIGVVYVLLVGEIDLSIGYVSAVAAVFMVLQLQDPPGWPWYAAVSVALILAAGIGVLHGIIITTFQVPSFIVSLAALIAWNGTVLLLVGTSGTVIIQDNEIVGIANHFLEPAWSWAVAIVTTFLFALYQIQHWLVRRRQGFVEVPGIIVLLRIVALGGLAAGVYGPSNAVNIQLIRTNRFGDTIWTQTYGKPGAHDLIMYMIDSSANGNYILSGELELIPGQYKGSIMKVDSLGQYKWGHTFANSEDLGNIHETTDRGFILSSTYNGLLGPGGNDFFLVKTDSAGNSGCYQSADTLTPAYSPIMISNPLTLVDSGAIEKNVTLLVSNVTIQESIFSINSPNSVPDGENTTNEITIFPNPSNGSFTIQGLNGPGEVIVYSSLGAEIYRKKINSKMETVEITGYYHGFYYLEAITNILPKAKRVLTTISGERRLRGNAEGMADWKSTVLEAGSTKIKITATPAQHGNLIARPFAG